MPPQQEENQKTPTPSPPLRICCYGSSSSRTPQPYLTAAKTLGYLLATHNHTCVNGAGSSGCMAAMNEGCDEGNGSIVGVIHEMFVVDGSDWCTTGAHSVFHSSDIVKKEGGGGGGGGGKRQILLAGGDDLQERKKLLVKGADALMVLPGGPGTWDELWEMACARNLGLTNIPIVCINTNGYYDGFQKMLQRGHEDELLYNLPHDIVHFEDSPEKALDWVEKTVAKIRREKRESNEGGVGVSGGKKQPVLQKRDSALGGTSFWRNSFSKSISRKTSWVGGKLISGVSSTISEDDDEEEEGRKIPSSSWSNTHIVVTFVTGVALGAAVVGTTMLTPRARN